MSYMGKVRPTVALTSSDIEDNAVTTSKLIDDAVTTAKIDDGTIATADIADDAVTADKLANAINTSIAANTAKVTNATHTGDVTGATALTIATDAVDIAMLSATGTASSSTFLRGDNAWAEAGGGKVLQVVSGTLTGDSYSNTTTTSTWTDSGLSVAITPTAATSKILVWCNNGFHCITSSSSRVSWQILENASSTVVGGEFQYRVDNSTFGAQFAGLGYYSCSDTAERTFKVQCNLHPSTSKIYYMWDSGSTHRIIAMEIGA